MPAIAPPPVRQRSARGWSEEPDAVASCHRLELDELAAGAGVRRRDRRDPLDEPPEPARHDAAEMSTALGEDLVPVRTVPPDPDPDAVQQRRVKGKREARRE